MLRDTYIDALLEKLDDKSYRDFAFDALKIFRSGPCLIQGDRGISIPFIDIYCQVPKGIEKNLFDLIEAAIAWQRVLSNKLKYGFILCKSAPKRDADKDGNSAILKELISLYQNDIVNAEFCGGNFGSDGYIEFKNPPIATKKIFPLEVGYCKSDQILTHIFNLQCFARFPYNYNFIIFFEDIEYKAIEL